MHRSGTGTILCPATPPRPAARESSPMMKVMFAVLAVMIAGTASAEGWRAMRFDASNQEAFTKSMEAFKGKLSPAREYVFGKALQDIWIAGTKAAGAEQRDYTDADYYA